MDEDARKLAVAAAEVELSDAVSALRTGQYGDAAEHLSAALSRHPSLVEAYGVLDDLTAAAGSADPFPLYPVDAVPSTNPPAGLGDANGEIPVGTLAGQAHLRAASGAYDSAVVLLMSGIAARPDLDWTGLPWFDDAMLAERLSPSIHGAVASVAAAATSVDGPVDGSIQLRLLRIVRRVIARNPYHHRLLAAGSALARPLGRCQEAVDWATRAERIEPSKNAALLLARAYGALGQVTDAEAAWLRAISRDAADVCLLHELADWLGSAGRLGDGIRYAERTLAVDPEHTHGLVTLHALRYQRDGDVRHLVALAGIARAGADGGHADRRLATACDGADWLNRVPRPVDAGSALLDHLLAGGRDAHERSTSAEPPSAGLATDQAAGGAPSSTSRRADDALAGGGNATDAREPVRPGRYGVWRFEAGLPVPAVATPSNAATEAVRRLPVRWWPHPPAAYDWGVYLSGLDLDDLLGLLVHPPAPPGDRVGHLLARSDRALWVRLVQAWTCLGIAHYRGDEAWPSSLRREVLTDLVFGPEDWVTEAALFALVATAWVVPPVRRDVADVVAERLAHAAAAARFREVSIAGSLATIALATPGLPDGTLRTANWLLATGDAQLLDAAPVAPLAPRRWRMFRRT